MEKGFSRRDFLKFGAAGAAGAAAIGLAGCSPAASGEGASTQAAEGVINSSEAVIKLTDAMPKWSFMVAPEPIPDDKITETIENDIIVVGAGMAGLTTAVAAAEKGANVTLFSASSAPISRGGSNYARNSKVMEELGVEPFDPSPFYYHEYRAASDNVDQRKWMKGFNHSEEAMNWMIDIAREAGLEVILERDNTFDLGPNYAHAFSTLGDSAMVSTGQQGAVEALEMKAKEYGVQLIYDTKAEQLIREDGGRVTGVVASKTSDGSYVKFVAKKAVVLATGDYSRDKEMLACYCPEALKFVGFEQEEIDYNTSFVMGGIYGGDGQKMGLWAGAAWQHAYPAAPMMQGAWGGSHEPCGFHMGLNVNMNTERYQREDISA
ncbi:FAD-dependent oxidoreductase, partial [uncultured Slackia sp.]|uniref:FAD-dependent oxidoreductase n=1 Tax=uncultured Slackia sp. TaxID=665903 RepID=UPI00261CFF8B